MQLKEQLHCRPFNDYLEMFKGRTFCDLGDKTCGGYYSVKPSDIKESVQDLFYCRVC